MYTLYFEFYRFPWKLLATFCFVSIGTIAVPIRSNGTQPLRAARQQGMCELLTRCGTWLHFR